MNLKFENAQMTVAGQWVKNVKWNSAANRYLGMFWDVSALPEAGWRTCTWNKSGQVANRNRADLDLSTELPIPLYGSVSMNGQIFCITFHGNGKVRRFRNGSSTAVFDTVPVDTPLIDFRSCNKEMLTLFSRMTAGSEEEHPVPYKSMGGPILYPLPDFLNLAQEYGATLTTIGEISIEFKEDKISKAV